MSRQRNVGGPSRPSRKKPHPPKAERDWLTEEEAGQEIGAAHSTMREWRYEKKGPKFYRAGRLIRYMKRAVQEWLDSNSGEAA